MATDRISQAAAALAAGGLDPAAMVRLVADASDGELRAVLGGALRERALDEVFTRAAEFMDTSRAERIDVGIEWRIAGGSTRHADRYFMVIGDGSCSVSRESTGTPDISFELDDLDFIRLVTGSANPAILFLTGRLRLRSDELLALEVARLFSLPTGGGEVSAAVDLAAIDAPTIAQVLADVPADQLRRRLRGPVQQIVLDEIFRRFPEYIDTRKTRAVHAVVEFCIGGGDGAPPHRYLVVIERGSCHAGRDLDADARVILELDDAADFLRLVTGNAIPAVDFLTGALRVRGDERFALELAGFFKMPSGDNRGGTVKLDPTAVDAELIARVVKTVPGDQLRERLAGGLRVEVLDEVFRRFPEYLHASKTQDLDAVVKFKIGGRSDGDSDRYIVVIKDGTCRAGSDIDAEPGVTIVVDAADFLKLVTGNLNPLTAFLRGRLKVKGDLVLAAQLPGLFAIPSAS